MAVVFLKDNDFSYSDYSDKIKSFILDGVDLIGIDVRSMLEVHTPTNSQLAHIISKLRERLIALKITVDEINTYQTLMPCYRQIKILILIPKAFILTETISCGYVLKNIVLGDIVVVDGIDCLEDINLISKAYNKLNIEQKLYLLFSVDNNSELCEILKSHKNLLIFACSLNDSNNVSGILLKPDNKILTRNFFTKGQSVLKKNIYFDLIFYMNDNRDAFDIFNSSAYKVTMSNNISRRIKHAGQVLICYWKNEDIGCQYFYSNGSKNIFLNPAGNANFKRIMSAYNEIKEYNIVCHIEAVHTIHHYKVIEFKHCGRSLRWLIIKRYFSLNEEFCCIKTACELYITLRSLKYEHCSACLDNVLIAGDDFTQVRIVFLDYIRKFNKDDSSFDIEKLTLDIICLFLYRDQYISERLSLYLSKICVWYDIIYDLCTARRRDIEKAYRNYEYYSVLDHVDSLQKWIFKEFMTQKRYRQENITFKKR